MSHVWEPLHTVFRQSSRLFLPNRHPVSHCLFYLTFRRNTDFLYIFFFSEFATYMPPLLWSRCTRLFTLAHPYAIQIPEAWVNFYISFASKLWNSFPSTVFPYLKGQNQDSLEQILSIFKYSLPLSFAGSVVLRGFSRCFCNACTWLFALMYIRKSSNGSRNGYSCVRQEGGTDLIKRMDGIRKFIVPMTLFAKPILTFSIRGWEV